MKPLKILLVDDDLEFGNLICHGLTDLGHKLHFQTSLAGIDKAIAEFSPSIIVLDVEIGDENGIKKAKELVSSFPSIPILFVSSHYDISYITEAIAAGGVNYLKKPFDIRELDAYIRRFAKKHHLSRETYIGNYLLDSVTSELSYEGVLIRQITPLEKNGLILLWNNKNRPVSLELISKNLWGVEYHPGLNSSIHNLISKLRKLLNRDELVRITTLKKEEGYQLTVLQQGF